MIEARRMLGSSSAKLLFAGFWFDSMITSFRFYWPYGGGVPGVIVWIVGLVVGCVVCCSSVSVGGAQETLEELLEIAGPCWERQRKQNYEQLAIRIEEFKDHRSEASNQIRRTRDSRDYFAEGAAKLIRRSGSSIVNLIKQDDWPTDSETFTWTSVTAQNAAYGFRVSRSTTDESWIIKQHVIWDAEPTWRWLMDPLPNNSPPDETLMRGLSLDPRLGVGESDNPLDLICGQIRKIAAEQHGLGEQHSAKIVHRVEADGKRVVTITFRVNRELDPNRLRDSEKDAVRYRTTVKIELLPDQDWQLLNYETLNDFLNDRDQTIRKYRWSSQVDYAPSDTKWLFRITDTEDASLGVIKTNRFIRLLTEAEQAELRPLCRLSGFGLAEPDTEK